MSNQQLYINDVAVDMPSERIKFKVESNLFSDASSIMTAHSYSISLPRTMRNDEIFALAFVAGADTGGKTTHTYLPCSLEVDGIKLFNRGRCVLSSVDDKGYKCNLYWGLLSIFDQIKDEGLDLCDLPMSRYWNENLSRWVYLEVYDDQLPQYKSGMTQEIYNDLDSESQELARHTPWILPSVPAITVLSDILTVYGLTLDLSAEANARLATLWHPLTTRKAMAKGEEVIINGVVQMKEMGSSGKYEPCFITPINDTNHQFNIIFAPLPLPDTPTTLNHSATNNYIANDAVSFVQGNQYVSTSRMTANADIKIKKVRIFGQLPYQATITIPNLDDREIRGTRQSSSDPFTFNEEINTEFSCASDDIVINISDQWGDPPTTLEAGTLNIQITLNDVTNVQVYRPWEFIRNYPSVGIINYIAEILAHIGGCIVGYVTTPNKLKIATLDEIVSATPSALDIIGVKTIKMTLDKLAQKNIYKHKENNDANTADEADGVIYTADSTLALERTAFDSKFKVPVQGKVLLWKVDGEKAEWNNAGDYIAGSFDDDYILDTGQNFTDTIELYYKNYEQIVVHPKMLEVAVRLSVLDLISLDFARPVHIEQLGRNYLIKSVETDSGDLYKLTLVQI